MMEKVQEFIDSLTSDELRTLRASVNGKLSRREITPEQQAKMQEGRRAARNIQR